MAYDEILIRRARNLIKELNPPELVEKKMFGGVGFLVRGNMACGVHGDDLIVRVGTDRYQQSLEKPFTKVFDMTGRPMRGWIMVTPKGFASDDDLQSWIKEGLDFSLSLPAK